MVWHWMTPLRHTVWPTPHAPEQSAPPVFSSTLPSQSLSMVSHESVVGPTSPRHGPQMPVPVGGHSWVPPWQGPTPGLPPGRLLQARVRSSTTPSQSLSSRSQISRPPPVPVQPFHVPVVQTSVPAVQTPTSVPQSRIRPSSMRVSQSSSRLLQTSVPVQLQIRPSSIWPLQLSSRLLQTSLVGIAPGIVMLQVVLEPLALQT